MTTPLKPDHEKRPFRFKLEGPFLRVSTMLLITPISPNFKGLKCSVFGRFRALQSRNIYGALIYLENFAPDEARERFEERIRSLFETKWIIELVDMAMLKIREYPDKGALYCEIISKAYLNRFKYRESEMLEVLNMERSTYYDRKKEAILLFGLSLWGTAIPKLKDFLESAREEEALCYCEC